MSTVVPDPESNNLAASLSDDEVALVAPARQGIGTFRALRHRNYLLYFVGQIISLTGSWMQVTALTWLAYQMTAQSLWPGLVMAAQLLPTLLLGAWGGSLADRFPKRPIIFIAQAILLLLALLLAGLVFSGHARPWHLLVIATANGIVTAIDLPARLAFVIDMVGRDDLINAVALNSLMFNAARALGPMLGAYALKEFGPELCFLLNGLSYVAVLIALALMDVDGRPLGRATRHFSLHAGFRYLADHGGLLLLLILSGAMALFGWPTLTLLPALAAEELHAGEDVYGWLLSGIGGGALLAALLVATFGSLPRRKVFLASGVCLAAAALAGLSQVTTFTPALACCTLLGCGLILFFPTGQAVMQLGATDDNRGLIMGIWSMVLTGATPLGNLLTGPAADRWGVPAVLAVQAGGIVVAAAAVLGLMLAQRRVE